MDAQLGKFSLFTLVPLRASASDILTEQTLGRGLRLPYGVRTGVEPIDRLTIIAHDRFDDVTKAAKGPKSVIQVKQVIIGDGGDVPLEGAMPVYAMPAVSASLYQMAEEEQPFFGAPSAEVKTVMAAALDVIQHMGRRLAGVGDLAKPEVQADIVAQVRAVTRPAQGTLEDVTGPMPGHGEDRGSGR